MLSARNSVRGGFNLVIARWIIVIVGALATVRPATAHPEILVQIEEVSARIAADPSNASLYLKRGDLHRDHEDWASALADFERARALDPQLRLVDFSAARMWLEAGNPGEALPLLQRFLRQDPDHIEGLTLRGRAVAALGQPRAAAADFGRVIDLGVQRGNLPAPEVFLWRAQAQMAAGGNEREAALLGLEQGLKLLGSPITLEVAALDVELVLQRVNEALRRVDRLVASSARPEPWLVRRAEILEQAGRRAESQQAYRAALDRLEALPDARRRTASLAALEQKARSALTRFSETQAQNGGMQ